MCKLLTVSLASKKNKKSFTKHLSLQKLNIISRTKPPTPVDAIVTIRKHQDVKAKVLRENFSGKPRIRLDVDPFLGCHPRALTLRRSPPWQYSMANSGKSFGASFCIPSGTSRAATTLGWFSLQNKNQASTCDYLQLLYRTRAPGHHLKSYMVTNPFRN